MEEETFETTNLSGPYPAVRVIGLAITGTICLMLPVALTAVITIYVVSGGTFVLDGRAGVYGSALMYAGGVSMACLFGYIGIRFLKASWRQRKATSSR